MFILVGCNINGTDFTDFMKVFKLVITVIQYAVPVALILWGSIDLFKSITTGKDDEIKKKQTLLFKKVLSAVIVFLLPWLVFTIMGLLGGGVKAFGNCYKDTTPGLPKLDSDVGYGNTDNSDNNSDR